MTKLELLKKLSSLQTKNHPDYADGLFPSQRFHLHIPIEREDNNIFFTASIVFVLQSIRNRLTIEEQKLADQICEKAIPNYVSYKNKHGLDTYSFWRTDGSPHFPNGKILQYVNKVRIPDDADDTSLIFLTSPQEKETVLWLKHKLTLHANLYKKQITNTYPEYKNLKAYSTFFGINMFIEFDVCVLCNLLFWIFKNKLELNQNDIDSIQFVKSVIQKKQYLKNPFYVSHSYPSSVIILYHISRLIEKFEISGLSDLKPEIISSLKMLMETEKSEMNRCLLSTSLKRLGVQIQTSLNFEFTEKKWSFFHAGLLTAFENKLTYSLAWNSFFHLKYKCEAHRIALLIENLAYS